jgi:hypothetical protein
MATTCVAITATPEIHSNRRASETEQDFYSQATDFALAQQPECGAGSSLVRELFVPLAA